jgi:PAS domain S-box-containing protein
MLDQEELGEEPLAELNRLRARVAELEQAEAALKDSNSTLLHQNEYLTSLHQASISLMHRLDLGDLLKDILNRAARLVGTDYGTIYLVEQDGAEILKLKAASGFQPHGQLKKGEGLAGKVWESGRPLCVDDYTNWVGRLRAPNMTPVRALAGVPLKFNEAVVGVFSLGYGEIGSRFNSEHLEILNRFGELASVALHNARLYEAAQQELAERRRAEQEAQKLIALVENSRDFIAITDLEGRLIYINKAGSNLIGLDSPEQAYRLTLPDLPAAEDLAMVMEVALPALQQHGSWTGELRLRHHQTGQAVWIDCNGFLIFDPRTGQAMAMATVSRDLTERKKAEEALRQSQDQLLQSQKMESIGRLAGGMAHDFNNLLTAITGYSDFTLQSLDAQDPVREDVLEIQSAADKAAGLTRQLLAFSRRQILQPRRHSLNTIVTEMHKLLQRLISENIELVYRTDQHLNEVEVDRGQLEQVLLNLVVNASDAMPGGGRLLIETANFDLEEAYRDSHYLEIPPGRYVLLAVSDTGYGMDSAVQDRIFEPFFTTKDPGKGTGLGLSTVYGIVSQSGGYIGVYSHPGKGSTFKIYLPAASAATEPDPEVAELEASQLDGTETILLVEDNEPVRSFSCRALEQHGYTVLVARNGSEALELYRNYPGPIQLVMTDMIMPQLGGRELIEKLVQLDPKLKVLAMSGYGDWVANDAGILEVCRAFLPKPFTRAQLALKVREVLNCPTQN